MTGESPRHELLRWLAFSYGAGARELRRRRPWRILGARGAGFSGYFAPATSFWKRGSFRRGSKLESIVSQARET